MRSLADEETARSHQSRNLQHRLPSAIGRTVMLGAGRAERRKFSEAEAFPEYLKSLLRAKRLIWCVRTILITRLAEDGQLVFAPKKLAELARSKAAKELLEERRRRRTDDKMVRNLSKFLVTEADTQRWHRTASFDEFVRRFRETSNDVAPKTLEQNERYPSGIYG